VHLSFLLIKNQRINSYRLGGSRRGEYIYHLTPTKTRQQEARCGCVQWYVEDVQTPWTPDYMPCPCSRIQAIIDPRFIVTPDYFFELINRYNLGLHYRTGNTSEWNLESGSLQRLDIDFPASLFVCIAFLVNLALYHLTKLLKSKQQSYFFGRGIAALKFHFHFIRKFL